MDISTPPLLSGPLLVLRRAEIINSIDVLLGSRRCKAPWRGYSCRCGGRLIFERCMNNSRRFGVSVCIDGCLRRRDFAHKGNQHRRRDKTQHDD
jgi:hypothetical protein